MGHWIIFVFSLLLASGDAAKEVFIHSLFCSLSAKEFKRRRRQQWETSVAAPNAACADGWKNLQFFCWPPEGAIPRRRLPIFHLIIFIFIPPRRKLRWTEQAKDALPSPFWRFSLTALVKLVALGVFLHLHRWHAAAWEIYGRGNRAGCDEKLLRLKCLTCCELFYKLIGCVSFDIYYCSVAIDKFVMDA